MKRRPGPIPQEYWGCTRTCWNLDRHTAEDGCEKYQAPCEHPVESIGWDSEGPGRAIECQDCQVPLSVALLAEEARVSIAIGGCCCPDECAGKCPPAKPTGWSLDPAKVLRILYLEGML